MTVIGRPREFDRDAALNDAMLLFWQKGFLATSMTDLCEAMGIRAPSLYAAFGSKETLYIEAIRRYADTVGPSIWGHLNRSASARVCIEKVLMAEVEAVTRYAATAAGCMVALAALSEDCPGAISDVARKIRFDCLESLRARFKEAVATGELSSPKDVDRLSRFYLGVYEGIAVQARDGATTSELKSVVETALDAWPASKAQKRR